MKKIFIILVISVICVLSLTAMARVNDDVLNNDSDSIQVLKQDKNFRLVEIEIKELSAEVALNRATAIEKAKNDIGDEISSEAKEITAIKAAITDPYSFQPIDANDKILKDYPAWIVTFHGVTLETNGPKGGTVYADKSIIIDANSGEILQEFAYSVQK